MASAPDLDITMSAQRNDKAGRWNIIASDGSLIEDGFFSRGAALRFIRSHSDVAIEISVDDANFDRQARLLVKRCSSEQRRVLRVARCDRGRVGVNRPFFGRALAVRGLDCFDTPPIALDPLFVNEPLLAGVRAVAEPFAGRGNW